MMNDFKEKTNKELIAFCEENGIRVNAKGAKPNKTELLDAIQSFFAEGDDVERTKFNEDTQVDMDDVLSDDVIEALEPDATDADELLDVGSPQPVDKYDVERTAETRAQKRKRQYKEMMKLKRVIIASNNTNQTKIKNQVNYCTWGNRLLGYHTDRYVLDTPWHVREGALRNLRNARITRHINDAEGNTVKFETVPAFIIQELPQLTKDEIKTIAKKQIIRESSIENLI
jgi:hypothetical protein